MNSNYPPGAAMDPNAPYNQEEIPDNWLLSEAFSDYESIGALYRATYKYTDCGPAIGAFITYYHEPQDPEDMCMHGDTVTKWFYCSDLDKFGTWAEMNERGERIDAINVSSIVEGVDEGTETIEIPCKHFDMEPEELRKLYWNAVDAVNKEAHAIWMATHGCNKCAELLGVNPETYQDDLPVHKDCPECGGQGTII